MPGADPLVRMALLAVIPVIVLAATVSGAEPASTPGPAGANHGVQLSTGEDRGSDRDCCPEEDCTACPRPCCQPQLQSGALPSLPDAFAPQITTAHPATRASFPEAPAVLPDRPPRS